MLLSTYPIPDGAALWSLTAGYRQGPDRWTAYLNQLAKAAIQPLLTEWFAPVPVRSIRSAAAQASQWSCVTGTPLRVGDDRWLLLPTEQIDEDGIAIPQEWIDLPEWAVQTIVAVEVNPDEAQMRILGYTTPAQVKAQAQYHSSDRTYELAQDDWITDFAVFQLLQTEQIFPTQIVVSQTNESAIASLEIAQARSLIQRLAALPQPRLAIPFQTWAALIQNPGWRQKLHSQRQSSAVSQPIAQPLSQPLSQSLSQSLSQLMSQWLTSGLQSGLQSAQNILENSGFGGTGWEVAVPAPIAVRGPARAMPSLIKPLSIQGQPFELRLYSIAPQTWKFELHPAAGSVIPQGYILRLLTEDLQPFEGNEAIASQAVSMLYITVELEPGDALFWEIEPEPDDFDRELIQME